ncbi:hypothetical protein JTB14_001975 [Gonioctena quinquepunctata]|nr:hypothetical protein JTB14_001975 [Gonioctena quinquepunctata]
MALSKLPKALGLGKELKKGYFPHLFNTKNYENYVGSLLRVEYYSPDTMKKDERKTFLEWYEKHKNEEFVMQRDLVEYCIADVDILTRACLKFRDQLLTTTNFVSIHRSYNHCNKVFRRNFLNSNSIGVILKNGYRYSDKQSKIAQQWLIWEEHRGNIVIDHASRGKETVLQRFKVDGYCLQMITIFEFQRCYFHGHPSCFKHNRDKRLQDNHSETLFSRYETTIFKTNHLRSLGYEVVEKWECDFRKELQSNQEIISYTENHPMISYSPLDPCQAFMGERTGNTKSYYKVKSGEKIKYVDVCSLYSWVYKYGLRQLAKHIVNSFWGKLGQRENQTKTKILNSSEKLFNLLIDPAIIVNALTPVDEETLVCNYEQRDEASESFATVYVCIAAYTTAQARLKLYSYLDRLTNRVLYYDTGSVIYISRDGEWNVPTESDSEYGGTINTHTFKEHQKNHEVVTKREIKQYQPNSTKRKFLSNHDSLPYGFKSQKLTP